MPGPRQQACRSAMTDLVDARDVVQPTTIARPYPVQQAPKGSMFLQVLHTTDHKLIGRMYLVTSFAFFIIGGVMALVMRAELARPGMQFLSPEQYNQLFTM